MVKVMKRFIYTLNENFLQRQKYFSTNFFHFRQILSQDLKIRDVWRTCNKIRAATFRVGLNLWDCYKPLDSDNDDHLSESKFVSVLSGPLRKAIVLSDDEIRDLTDYFQVEDGRIQYSRLCEMIHDCGFPVSESKGSKLLVVEPDSEDSLYVNPISLIEHKKLCLIITKIAVMLKKRKLVLKPYFQDYALISENTGTVTFAHFGRVLKFLGIIVASDEFNLLIKRFAKDNYSVNYVAFMNSIDEAQNYMNQHGIFDLAGDVVNNNHGEIITAELPKVPRPEIGTVMVSEVFMGQTAFHPVMEKRKRLKALEEVVQRLQRHIFELRIPIHDFFKDFDASKLGTITKSQFKRGLDGLQVSSVGRLYFEEPEIDALISLYKDSKDPERVHWAEFADDMNCVFTVKGLEKHPGLIVKLPPREIAELSRAGQKNWQCQDERTRQLCEETLRKIRRRVEERRIYLKQFFKDYDILNHGHVMRNQMRRVFTAAVILLSPEETLALEERYNDDLGFNYSWFLEELESRPIEHPLYSDVLEKKKLINAPKMEQKPTEEETNIVLVLAKIKAKVVRERINVSEFMKPFDVRNEQVICKEDFVRGLNQLRCNLTCNEIATITEVFKSRKRNEFIEYARFAAVVEEAVATGFLEKSPLFSSVQHIPSEACRRTFLNFEERQLVAQAMDKLVVVKHPNLEEIFADFDKENIGSVTKDKLIKALSARKMLLLISNNELDALHKCFSIERGGRLEIDYRAFLRALYFVNENKKTLPF